MRDSGNSASISGVANSGNSKNDIDNTNKQAQGQQQGQAQGQKQSINDSGNSSSASEASNNGNGNGNGSNNTQITTNYKAAQIPVATAYAPTAFPTANCAMGYSGGAQGLLAGATGGFTRIDKTCQQLEVARSFAISGARKSYCMVMIQTKWAKKAGVKLEDCMLQDAPPVPAPAPATSAVTPAVPVTPAVAVPVIVNPTPADPAPAPVQLVVKPVHELIGICTFPTNTSSCSLAKTVISSTRVTSICDEMLDAAIAKLKADPKATLTVLGSANSNEELHIASDRTQSVRTYLVGHGIESARIHLGTDKSGNRTTALWLDTVVSVPAK